MSSCPSSNAPLDITKEKVSGNCDQKCSYQYQYQSSTCVATNKGGYISLAYDKAPYEPVLHNGIKYDVTEVRLFMPSMHTFRNSRVDAELVIMHKPDGAGDALLVCVPINATAAFENAASRTLKAVVQSVAGNAPQSGESTTVNNAHFQLNDFIPAGKPFFAYTATSPLDGCNQTADFVVFDAGTGTFIDPSVLATWKKLMPKPISFQTQPGALLYWNAKGAQRGRGATSDEIYIDCKPVNASTESETVVKDKKSQSKSRYQFSWEEMQENPYFLIFLQALLFIVAVGVFAFLIRILSGRTKSILKPGSSSS